jgi:hypothetical protein
MVEKILFGSKSGALTDNLLLSHGPVSVAQATVAFVA